MRWSKWLGALALITIVATGCIRFDGEIVINDDGTGSGEWIIAVDAEGILEISESLDLPSEGGDSPEDICNDFEQDAGADPFGMDTPASGILNPQASAYDEDGFCGTRVTFELAASNDHSATVSDFFGDGTRTQLFKEGDNWIFNTELDASQATEGTEGAPDEIAQQFFEDASYKIVIDLPGRAIDGQNNATSVGADGRFEWDLNILELPDRIFAQTEPGSGGGDGGGGGIGLILIIIAIVLLAAAAAWWFLTQRNSGGTAPAMATPSASGGNPTGFPPTSVDPAPIVPVKPSNPSAQATIAMSAADAQAATEVPTGQPVYDEQLGAWVMDDPNHGRLVHDPESDTWKPA